MNDDRQAGSKEIGGGGEWTALRELSDWLREQSEELMKNAIGRESTAAMMRASTPQELREAKKTAEMMMGRKLPKVSTGVEETKVEADMQCSIAAKLDKRARQLSTWADQLEALAAAAPAPPADCDHGNATSASLDTCRMTRECRDRNPLYCSACGNCENEGHDKTCPDPKEFTTLPPQDGQGAELPHKWTCGNSDHACNLRGYCVNENCSEFSRPPRGGSSSDLADSRSLNVDELAEHITCKIQSLLSDKYTNSFKIAYGVIGQELRAAFSSLPHDALVGEILEGK